MLDGNGRPFFGSKDGSPGQVGLNENRAVLFRPGGRVELCHGQNATTSREFTGSRRETGVDSFQGITSDSHRTDQHPRFVWPGEFRQSAAPKRLRRPPVAVARQWPASTGLVLTRFAC